jgi:hypothetical protein
MVMHGYAINSWTTAPAYAMENSVTGESHRPALADQQRSHGIGHNSDAIRPGRTDPVTPHWYRNREPTGRSDWDRDPCTGGDIDQRDDSRYRVGARGDAVRLGELARHDAELTRIACLPDAYAGFDGNAAADHENQRQHPCPEGLHWVSVSRRSARS